MVNILGYQVAAVTRRARGRRDGARAKGGDVAVYVRNGLSFSRLEGAPLAAGDDVIEWCGVRVFGRDRKYVDVHNLYRPPIRPGVNDERQDRFDPSTLPSDGLSLVVGDLNAHHPRWDGGCQDADRVGQSISDWADNHRWTILNNGEPTFVSYRTGAQSTPDIVMCSEDLARRAAWSVEKCLGSDHLPQLVTLQVNFGRPRRIRKTRWAFHKAQWDEFTAACEEALASPPEDLSVGKMTEWFTGTIVEQATRYIPRGARADAKPWALDPELAEAAGERRTARQELRTNPSAEAKERWIAAKKRARDVEREASQRSFREFVSTELNQPSSIGRVTKVLRKMEGGSQTAAPGQAINGDQGRLKVEDKAKATAFTKTYAEVSRQVRAPKQDRRVKVDYKALRGRPCSGCTGDRRGCCSAFTPTEMEAQLRKCKSRRAPGPDDICAEHLKYLGPVGKRTMLALLNRSWLEGSVPDAWRRAVIVPIMKSGKDPKLVSSYRPIALTSHLAKLMERMVLARLTHTAEEKRLIPPEQVGFRRGRCVEDSIGCLVQNVHDGWNLPKRDRRHPKADAEMAQKYVLLAFDFARAYDKIDHHMLRLKLLQMGVPSCMVSWIWQFLRNRRACTEVNGVRSAERPFRAGLPQGAVLSPTLYTLWAADLVRALNSVPGTTTYMYADDTATLSGSADMEVARKRAQQAADVLVDWCRKWKMVLAGEKSQLLVLSQWAKDASSCAIRVAGATVSAGDSLRLLGVTMDRLLNFGKHVESLHRKVRPRTAQLRKLTGRSWGLQEQQLRTVANGYVRGSLEHAAAAWLPTTAATHVEALDREMRAAARAVTGCTRSTPVDALMAEAGLMPMGVRKKVLATRLLCRARSLPQEEPLRAAADATVRQRIKATDGWRSVGRRAMEETGIGEVPIEERLMVMLPPWEVPEGITITTDIDTPTRRTDSESVRRAAAERHLEALPAPTVAVWSDGSASGGTADGGGGAAIYLEDGTEHTVRAPAGAVCSSCGAELVALRAALAEVKRLRCLSRGDRLLICTDSQSALAQLQSGPEAQRSRIGADIWRHLMELAGDGVRAHLQWVPAHCGLPGNERADALAKEAAELPQQDVPPDTSAVVKAVARQAQKTWIASWRPGFHREIMEDKLPPPVEDVDRGTAVDVHQLRSGHWSGSRQYLHRIGKLPTDDCAQCEDVECRAGVCILCQEEADTPAHVLLRCPAIWMRRRRMLGDPPDRRGLRDTEVVANLASGYRALQSQAATQG